MDDQGFKPTPLMMGSFAAIVLGLAIAIAFFAGRGCTPKPVEPPVIGIDAGPGDVAINDRLDARVQQDEAAIREAEKKHAEALAALSAEQQHEYDQIRERGPDAVSDYLRRVNSMLRDGGAQ